MNITEDDLTAELRRLDDALNPTPAPGEFTALQYAAANGITYDVAKGRLHRGVKSGVLTSRLIGRQIYYRQV
jgi:hypothetical protein